MTSEDGYVAKERVGVWDVTAWWPPGVRGGPHELRIRPADDAEPHRVASGISTATLIAVPLPEMTRRHLEQAGTERYEQAWPGLVHQADTPRKRGATFYSLIAFEFARLAALGEREPVQVMARRLDRSPDSVRNWLRTARQMDLLTREGGRVSGKLTVRAFNSIVRVSEDFAAVALSLINRDDP